MKTLQGRRSPLADARTQLKLIRSSSDRLRRLPAFGEKLQASGLMPFRPTGIEIFQVNVGKMCNQTCKHCHVDAGPDRKEIMTRETMELCLEILARSSIPTVDITGGAPEMNPHFRWFVAEIRKIGRKVMDRCNLTILLANEKYRDLPRFFADHQVHVVSSLPYPQKGFTDRQRGEGVFDKSIQALKRLNEVGYGREGSGLELDLVYNPAGAFLPAPQVQLEADFKRQLKAAYGIEFNRLYTITNMPISRYLEYLEASGNLEDYLEKLVQSFNPSAAAGVMCRNTISVGWDGTLYDCDFNQQLDLPVAGSRRHLKDFDSEALSGRDIVIDQHCYGCTAGSGSSCGGQLV